MILPTRKLTVRELNRIIAPILFLLPILVFFYYDWHENSKDITYFNCQLDDMTIKGEKRKAKDKSVTSVFEIRKRRDVRDIKILKDGKELVTLSMDSHSPNINDNYEDNLSWTYGTWGQRLGKAIAGEKLMDWNLNLKTWKMKTVIREGQTIWRDNIFAKEGVTEINWTCKARDHSLLRT
jgi:hypothetical protein